MATFIPGVNFSVICDGETLAEQWHYYTVNVKLLGTLTHEQFCQERPEAAREIERASKLMDKWKAFAEGLET